MVFDDLSPGRQMPPEVVIEKLVVKRFEDREAQSRPGDAREKGQDSRREIDVFCLLRFLTPP